MTYLMLNLLLVFILASPLVAEPSWSDREKEEGAADYIGVSLEVPQETQELIGLTTTRVESSETAEKILVNGRIAQDVDKVIEVFSPEVGIVKECLGSIGSIVSKGQIICVVEGLASKNTIEISSPSTGVVIADYEKVGDPVDTISPIHTIADYSKLFSNFDVYEKDIGKVKMGQKVLVYSIAYPEKPFEGKIVFISPRVDETSFTIKIRVQIDNPDYLLKPGMFLRGEIMLDEQSAHFVVSSEAVQNLEGTNVVFVKDEAGSFIPIEVKVKFAGRKQTSVEGDIHAGDLVVADGAYILKSKIMESEIVGGCGSDQ